jgi:hypothetical protein
MADVTLKTDRFPQGTNVGVYPIGARQDSRSPAGTSVATATVAADQTLAFTGLADGTNFVAYAQVGSEHRYVTFNTVAEASTIASPSGGATVDAQARTAIDSIRTVLKNAGLTS